MPGHFIREVRTGRCSQQLRLADVYGHRIAATLLNLRSDLDVSIGNLKSMTILGTDEAALATLRERGIDADALSRKYQRSIKGSFPCHG